MKAWRIDQHGGLDALKLVDLPEPAAGATEVRVQVQAVGLNHLDLWVRKGVSGHQFPLPLIPGCDISGVIEKLGPEAERALAADGIGIGAEVIVSPGISCGRCEACLGGFDPLCKRYGILGETQNGGCAEKIVVPATNIIARPQNLDAAQAASIPIPYLTAWTMLVRKAQIRPGQTVLVQAGGSGVSIAAIQIAKLFSAQVITTVGSDAKIAQAQAIGADHVVNYKKTSFREEVKKITGKIGCDIVVDHVGADTFMDSVKSLRWGGSLVTCGATSGSDVSIDLKHVFFKNISILGSTMGSKADLLQIIRLMRDGKLKPIVDSKLPFAELPKAHAKLESRNVFGKVVVTL